VCTNVSKFWSTLLIRDFTHEHKPYPRSNKTQSSICFVTTSSMDSNEFRARFPIGLSLLLSVCISLFYRISRIVRRISLLLPPWTTSDTYFLFTQDTEPIAGPRATMLYASTLTSYSYYAYLVPLCSGRTPKQGTLLYMEQTGITDAVVASWYH